MAFTDSQITFTETGGSATLTLDVYIMPVDVVDFVAKDVNGENYQRDVATAAFIPQVNIRIHRCSLTRANFDQLWTWMINFTQLDLVDLANDVPIASYLGHLSSFQADMFHHAKIGPGPYDIIFKPDSAARP